MMLDHETVALHLEGALAFANLREGSTGFDMRDEAAAATAKRLPLNAKTYAMALMQPLPPPDASNTVAAARESARGLRAAWRSVLAALVNEDDLTKHRSMLIGWVGPFQVGLPQGGRKVPFGQPVALATDGAPRVNHIVADPVTMLGLIGLELCAPGSEFTLHTCRLPSCSAFYLRDRHSGGGRPASYCPRHLDDGAARGRRSREEAARRQARRKK